MTFQPTNPFNALPELPPKGVELETVGILRECIAAHRALGELNGIAKSVPNPQLLIDTLALQEAQASSSIENIVTTGDMLYRFMALGNERSDPATRVVARYRPAIFKGMDMLASRPFITVDLCQEICTQIVGFEAGVRALPVRLQNPGTGEVVYTPPDNRARILDLFNDLQRFIHSQEPSPDPLVRLAVFHYQFEAIHPFPDGNGRTGRVLNILYLIQQSLLDQPILYLSRYFQRHRGRYYSLLRSVTQDNEWREWIAFVLGGIAETAKDGGQKIAQLRELRTEFSRRAQVDAPSASSEALLDLLFMRPYSTISMVEEAERVSRPTARAHLLALQDAGMLSSVKVGRWRLFVNDALVQTLFG